MKGVIFNILEEALTAEYGSDAWVDLVEIAGVSGAYTSLGSYADEEVLALVSAAAGVLDTTPADVLRWFGRAAMPLMHQRFPAFFTGHPSTRSFLLSLNEIIHPEVRKLYAGAGCPHFQFADLPDGRLVLGYRSPRQLCALVEGFVAGASDRFNEHASIEHLDCMLDGAPACRVAVGWAATAPSSAEGLAA